jgi:alkylation response protein AidB-like acyl-CoA dehydrogenase
MHPEHHMSPADEEPRPEAPEHAAFRREVRRFLKANASPKRTASTWALTFHTDEAKSAREFEAGRAWQRTLFEHGFAGLTYPENLGGRGGPPWYETIYREESAQFDVSSGYIASTMAMLGPTLLKWATERQCKDLIPRMLSGEDAWCQLFSEPGAGSDLAGLACRAVRDGDEFVITGQKVWNSAAQWCTKGMLLVRTDPDAPKHKGITFLLVDMDTPGVEVRPMVQANGAHHFNEVFFTEARLPVANVLGDIDQGWHVARTVLSNESAFIGSASAGSTFERLLALSRRFDRNTDPVVRQELSTAFTRERLLQLMSDRIMTALRRREPPPLDPSILKLYVADNRAQTGSLAVALMGANGIASTEDDEVSLWSQSELLARFAVSIGGGTNEVQRNNIAERALGLPREPRNDHELPWKDVPRS